MSRILDGQGISIARSLVGNYITSLEMAGFSVTLLRLDDELTRLWDAPVHTAGPALGRLSPPLAACPLPAAAAARLPPGRRRPPRSTRLAATSQSRGTDRISTSSTPGCGWPPARLHERAAELTALDQAIGDGDHGTNIDRGFTRDRRGRSMRDVPDGDEPTRRVAAGAPADRRADAHHHRRRRGRAALRHGAHAGRRRPSLRRSDGEAGAAFVAALEAAIAGIQALGKATTGEKTMLDALVPGRDAGRAALDAGRRRRRS